MATVVPRFISQPGQLKPSDAVAQKLKKTAVQYRNSFNGNPYFQFETEWGRPFNIKHTAWLAKDKAEERANELGPAIANLLLRTRGDWDPGQVHPDFEWDPIRGRLDFALRIYMVGSDQEHAAPYIAVICRDEAVGNAIVRIIRGNGCLKLDQFKCFWLPLDITTPAGVDLINLPAFTSLDGFSIWANELPPAGAFNGVPIEIHHHSATTRTATIGGVISIGNELFGLTVNHAFRQAMGPPPLALATQITADKMDADSDSDDDIVVIKGSVKPLPAFPTSGPAAGTISTGSDGEIGASLMTTSDHHVFDPHSGALEETDTDPSSLPSSPGRHSRHQPPKRISTRAFASRGMKLDYALVDIPPSWNAPVVQPNPQAAPDTVVLKTGLDRYNVGQRISRGILGLPTARDLPRVSVVRMGSAIQPGDCGAWGMTLHDGNFFGMLAATCPALGEAYFISLPDIVDDIFESLGNEGTVVKTTPAPGPPYPITATDTCSVQASRPMPGSLASVVGTFGAGGTSLLGGYVSAPTDMEELRKGRVARFARGSSDAIDSEEPFTHVTAGRETKAPRIGRIREWLHQNTAVLGAIFEENEEDTSVGVIGDEEIRDNHWDSAEEINVE